MESIGHFIKATLPYLLQGLLGLIALIALVKDWKDYGDATSRYANPLRIAVLVFTVAVIFLSFVDTHNSRREATIKEAGSKKQIDDLTEQIRLEREENKHNSDGFRQSFDGLYQRYSDLASKAQNADLLREIKRTRDELKTTQDKLNQPKARLVAGFWLPNTNDEFPHEINTPRRPDGSVVFDISAQNGGDVHALKGSLIVRICSLCKFAKEPLGSVHALGSPEEDREIQFDHIFAHSNLEKYTIEVLPQPTVKKFQIDIFYACENCVSEKQSLFVTIQ